MLPSEPTLRSLLDVRPLYFLPTEPLADEVLIPAFRNATTVDCMTGFFSSEALASLAPGLASYINTSPNPFRLVISPVLQPNDQTAIENGVRTAESVVEERLAPLLVTEDLLQLHTLRCLSWLIATDRISIKIALMKSAIFHPKVWIFRSHDAVLVTHGSSNVTAAGLTRNIEQIAVSQSWLGPTDRYMTDKFIAQFEHLYGNRDDDCIVVDLPHALRHHLLTTYRTDQPPTEDDFRDLYRKAVLATTPSAPRQRTAPSRQRPQFAIPPALEYTHGPFRHQGTAVRAWCEAGYRGVLEMATGSGKTITAMICAYQLHTTRRPLLVVVAAPYVPLLHQWCEEITAFGLRPINLSAERGARARARELGNIKRRLRTKMTDVEIIVLSHDLLCSDSFTTEIQTMGTTTLLIADEVHNLGRHGFTLNPPSFFDHRIGLSATPVRQYDDAGTSAIFSFFGPVVFRFSLRDAIGFCLVEYDYHVHPISLTEEEMDKWRELTATIKSNAWRQDRDPHDDYVMRLRRARRLILESAANKVPALCAAIDHEDLSTLRHTLVYPSDKSPNQLEQVNALLRERGVLFRQLTYRETADHQAAADILAAFRDGELRVLTAMRVLDEGVDIPQVRKAFILASTTVERQWIQRRGRLLRKCAEVGKTHAEVHDFVALPPAPDSADDDVRNLVRAELTRVQEFASLARNAGRPDGALPLITELARFAYE